MAMRCLLSAIVVAWAVSACSGVGIMATSDPYEKVSQAEYLYTGPGRAAQARRLLDEAIRIFKERGDNVGLGEAYRQYAFLARRGGARSDVILIFKGSGRAASREDIALSNDYFQRAAAQFEQEKRFDNLSNVYLYMGSNFHKLGEKARTCDYLDRSLVASRKADARRPDRKVALPKGINTFSELIDQTKRNAGCS